MNQTQNIAVLLTCHNRRKTTLECLRSLFDQVLPNGVVLETYLVDDACTDGTVGAIREQFPDVNILQGDGNLYWCGGMRLAWSEAMKGNYDAYLWLNDDTILLPGAIQRLLITADEVRQREGRDGIVVGSCRDPKTGHCTYGGSRRNNQPIKPSARPQPCVMMNGNVVLIPYNVSKVVGNISPEFTHTSGDIDYGLRAIQAGFKLWIAPGYQGLCSKHTYISWADPSVPLRERLRSLHSPKGLPPYERYVYARRHSGFFWPMDLVRLYLRVLFPGLYRKLKRRVKSSSHTRLFRQRHK